MQFLPNFLSLFPAEFLFCWFMMDYIRAPRKTLFALLLTLLDVSYTVWLTQYNLIRAVLFLCTGIAFILVLSKIPRLYSMVYYFIRLFVETSIEASLSIVMLVLVPEQFTAELTSQSNMHTGLITATRLCVIPLVILGCLFIRWLCNRIFHTTASEALNQYVPFLVLEAIVLYMAFLVYWKLFEQSSILIGLFIIALFLCMIVLDLLLMRTIEALKKSHQTELQLSQMQQLVRAMSRSYDQFKESNRIIRALRHDMDNQLYSLSLLLDQQEYALASQQLTSYRSAVARTRNHIYTGNPVVDAVIYGKMDGMAAEDISFSCTGTLPDDLTLDPAILCSLTANLLDNAIHACERIPTAPRDILFSVGIHSNRLILRCENSCTPDTQVPTDHPDDPTLEHGWGLQIIRQIAELCSGTAVFTVKGQRFLAVTNLDLTSEVKSW